MKTSGEQDAPSSRNRIVTIPNAMSLFRLILIPVFIWMYHFREWYLPSTIVLLLSCLTDLLDGWVARRFNMVSDLGKMLDPVADKLTQGILMLCLVWEFRILLLPLILLIVKECTLGIMNVMVIRKSGEVHGAEMHGKITTWMLDLTIFLHVIWHQIPTALSTVLSVVCAVLMIVSLILYLNENRKWFR